MLKTSELTKSFSTPAGELEVLKGIDLDVRAGEIVAIMGSSGVGKSTLLHILGTLDRPTSGKVFYDDTDVFALGEQELAGFRNVKVGFVFQFHHLLPEFSALENTVMPALIQGRNIDEASGDAGELLSGLGLQDRLDHRPGELSGGEQQRVAVARALMLEPSVVLADEPTGNLDTATGQELFELLTKINESHGTTFVIATHNESLAKKCSRVLSMVDGKLRAD